MTRAPKRRSGLRGASALAAALCLAACGGGDVERPTVVLIVLDALTAERVGHLGHERDTTPNLDALAREGVTCTQALSPAPYTLAGIPSILTGRLPDRHGLVAKGDLLPESERTLAERLREVGYETFAAVGNLNGGPDFGALQGFDEVVAVYEPSERFPADVLFDGHASHRPRAEELVDLAQEWLAGGLGRDAPALLYLHLLEPHTPYEPPPEIRARFVDPDYDGPFADGQVGPLLESNFGRLATTERDRQAARDLYDATLHHADRELGRLFDALRAAGLWDTAWVIVTSDHGEAFWQHGRWGHNEDLFEEMLRVPLILKPPLGRGVRGRVVDRFVSTVDLVPTLIGRLGLEREPDHVLDGVDLGPLLDGEQDVLERRSLVLRTNDAAPHLGLREADGDRIEKGIVFRRQGRNYRIDTDVVRTERFDLVADPDEQRPLGPVDPAVLERLAPWLEVSVRRDGRPGRRLRPDQEALLRSLGYVDD